MAHGPIQYASRYGRCAFRRSLFGGMLVSVRNHKLVCLILISILCILGCASLSQAIQREARRVRLVHMRLPVIIGRPKACCGQVHPEVGLCLPSLVNKRSFHATLKYVTGTTTVCMPLGHRRALHLNRSAANSSPGAGTWSSWKSWTKGG